MRKKMLFVFNPRSGKGRIKTSLFDIIDTFTKGGYDVTAYPTQAPGDCHKRVAQDGDTYDIVVASGGDGTLNETVGGMLEFPRERRVPIGYIPAGTMNDFASGNGIPKRMTGAAETVVSSDLLQYDIGSFNDKCFIYVAAFGAFTDVSYDTPHMTKSILGPAAYFLEGVKRLPKIEGIDVKITTDEGEVINEKVLICLIMNSTSIAGIEVGEFYDVNTNDGLFEIVTIPLREKITDIASIVGDLIAGRLNSDGIHTLSTKGAHIEIEKPVRWTLDGEFGGETDTVDFKVNHNAVDFVIKN